MKRELLVKTLVSDGYALISNLEWMTIAHNIYNQDSNWSGATVGSGFLNRGHSDNDPSNTPCDGQVENVQGDCSTLDPNATTTNWIQKRTHNLSNGQVIWDMAGNVWNSIDWNITPSQKAYVFADGAPANDWRDWENVDTNINNGDEMETLTWQSPDPSATTSMGIGRYWAGNDSSGGAAVRGGRWPNATGAGLFAMDLTTNSSFTYFGTGFRCVYRP